MDVDRRLVVRCRRENLFLLVRDRGVPFDQCRHDAAQRLDAQGKRSHVEQKHVGDVAREHSTLDRGADRGGEREHEVRDQVLAPRLPEEAAEQGQPAEEAGQDGHQVPQQLQEVVVVRGADQVPRAGTVVLGQQGGVAELLEGAALRLGGDGFDGGGTTQLLQSPGARFGAEVEAPNLPTLDAQPVNTPLRIVRMSSAPPNYWYRISKELV